MAHSKPSLMIPPSLSTSSPLTCTPIRPSTRPSTGHLQISSSDETYHCNDPINVSFGSLADLHSPARFSARLAQDTAVPSITSQCTVRTPLRAQLECSRRHKDEHLGLLELMLHDHVHKLGRWSNTHLGGHDMVRRVARNGEGSIWCRKCSGYGRQRMGPKQVNFCKLEQVGTKDFCKMLKTIQTLEEGRESQRKRQRIGELRGRKEKNYEKGVQEAVRQF